MSTASSSSSSVPRVVGVAVAVVLAAAASIVFVANTGARVEVSAAVERYLKSSLKGSSSSEITVVDYTSFKSESPASPLFMQSGDHPVKLLLKKYGLTGTGKTLKTPKTSGGKKDADKGNGKGAEASSSTWVFGALGAKADCSGREYTTAGIKANTCISVEGTGSMMLTCNSPDISVYMYDNGQCSGAATESYLLGQTGCSTSLTTPWGEFAANDDAYTASVLYSCVTADAVKGPTFGDYHYDVLTGYTSPTCDTSSYYYFEAYTGDTCIPFSGTYGGTNSANGGAVFKYNGDGAISNQMYAKFYASDPTCSGPKYHATLPSGCIANTEADGAAQWLYYYVDNVYGNRKA